MKKHTTTIQRRIYIADTDAGGVVHHAAYLRLLEQARTDWLVDNGLSIAGFMDAGLISVVGRIDIDYLRPLRVDDMVAITTRLVGYHREEGSGPSYKGPAGATFVQSFMHDGEVASTAMVRLVFVNTPSGKPARLSKELRVTATAGYAGLALFKSCRTNERRRGDDGASSWDLLDNGMSWEDALAAGCDAADLTADIDRDDIMVRLPRPGRAAPAKAPAAPPAAKPAPAPAARPAPVPPSVATTEESAGLMKPLPKVDRAQDEAAAAPASKAKPEPAPTPAPTSAPAPAAAADAVPVLSKRRGRPSKYAGRQLYKKVAHNPRRANTPGARSWERLDDGMYWEQALDAGCRGADLTQDIERDNIEVRPPLGDQPKVKPKVGLKEPPAKAAQRAKAMAVNPATPQEQETGDGDDSAAPDKGAEATDGKRPGRRSQYAGTQLFRLVAKNPRRVNTPGWVTWSKFRDGMTWEDALAAGCRAVDLTQDIKRELIEARPVKDASATKDAAAGKAKEGTADAGTAKDATPAKDAKDDAGKDGKEDAGKAPDDSKTAATKDTKGAKGATPVAPAAKEPKADAGKDAG